MIKRIKAYLKKQKELRFGTQLRWHALKRLLKKEVSTGSLLLDIGSYDGYIAAELRDSLKRLAVIVADTDSSGLQAAGRRGLLAMQASALELPLQSTALDWVLCLDVIEHVEQDEAMVREMARVLKVGGRIILTTPVHTGVDFPFMSQERVDAINRDWGHVRTGYSIPDFERIFAGCGLVLEKKSRYFNVISRWVYRLAALSRIPVRGSGFLFRLLVRLEPFVKFRAQEHIIIAKKVVQS